MKKIFLLTIVCFLLFIAGNQIFAATRIEPDVTAGQQYTSNLLGLNGLIRIGTGPNDGALPEGLYLSGDGINSAQEGVSGDMAKIIGKTNKTGLFNFKIIVDNKLQDFSIYVNSIPLEIDTPLTELQAKVGQPLPDFILKANGGVPGNIPYIWTNPVGIEKNNAGIPLTNIGLTLLSQDNGEGVIRGVPIKEGTYDFNITVTDKAEPIPNTKNGLFRINITTTPSPTIITNTLSPGQKDTTYKTTVSAEGGTLCDKSPCDGYNWTFLVKPDFIDPIIKTNALFQGEINGNPKTEGIFKAIVQVRDKKDKLNSKEFEIKIEKSCQCTDSTPCSSCKIDSSLYCNGDKQATVNNPTLCPGDKSGGGSQVSEDTSSSGKIPERKMEINWPNSPMGTPLNNASKLVDLVKYLYEWGIGLGGFAAFIALIYAGFQYLTSVGNAGKMTQAVEGIKSAGLGLVLLLSAFLILNTVNPQLTELKMPKVDPNIGGLTTIKVTPWDNTYLTGAKCTKVFLCTGPDAAAETCHKIPIQGENLSTQDVGSIKMYGNCQVVLYKLKDFLENDDNPAVVISGMGTDEKPAISNTAIYGNSKFGSVKFNDISRSFK